MTWRVLVAVVAGSAGLAVYATGFSLWLAAAAAFGIVAAADRLGLMPAAFEPTARNLLHDVQASEGGVPEADSPIDTPGLSRVDTVSDIRETSPDVDTIVVNSLTDEKLAAIGGRLPGLRCLFTNGANTVTDDGLEELSQFVRLEHLDLERSNVTDTGLRAIAAIATLRFVDLDFCNGVTREGVQALRVQRPDLEVSYVQRA
jgi:hypothetical protein